MSGKKRMISPLIYLDQNCLREGEGKKGGERSKSSNNCWALGETASPINPIAEKKRKYLVQSLAKNFVMPKGGDFCRSFTTENSQMCAKSLRKEEKPRLATGGGSKRKDTSSPPKPQGKREDHGKISAQRKDVNSRLRLLHRNFQPTAGKKKRKR